MKKLNQIIVTLFLVSQVILGPLGMVQASASTIIPMTDVNDENMNTLFETENESEEPEEITEDIDQEKSNKIDKEQGDTIETDQPAASTPEQEESEGVEQEQNETEGGAEDNEDVIEEDTEEVDEERNAQSIQEQVSIQFDSLQIGAVTVKDENDAANVKPQMGETVKVKYNFDLPVGYDYKAGETFTLQLPQSLVVFESGSLSGVLRKDGHQIRYTTDANGLVTFELLSDIGSMGTAGDVKFIAHFDEKGSKEGLEQELVIPVEGGSITIPFTFTPKNEGPMTKTGKHVGAVEPTEQDKNEPHENIHQRDLFEWEVWVNNDGKDLPAGTQVTDELDGKHEYYGTINVEKYNIGLSGKVGSALETFTVEQFPVTLPEGPYAYKITYQTKANIEDLHKRKDRAEKDLQEYTFKNKVTHQNETAEAEVTEKYDGGAPDPVPLYKTGTHMNNSGEIHWTILVNEKPVGKTDINDNIHLSDILQSPDHMFMKETFMIKKIYDHEEEEEINEVLDSDEYKLTFGGGEWNSGEGQYFEIRGLDKNYAYEITYDTKPVAGLLTNDKDVPVINKVKNNVEDSKEKSVATVNIAKQQSFVKERSKVDYENRTIDWTIKVNITDTVNDFVIEDTFLSNDPENSHQTLVGDGLAAFKFEGGPQPTEPTIDPTKGFTFKFGKLEKGTSFTITYQTKYDLQDSGKGYGEYINKADASFISPNDGKTHTITQEKSLEVEGKPEGSNGFKDGTYNHSTHTIDWQVGVNYALHELNGATVTDTLGEGHALVPNTIKVYKLDISEGGKGQKGEEVTEGIVIQEENASYTVTFNTGEAQAYLIEYETKPTDLEQLREQKEYSNTAVYTAPNGKTNEYTGKVEYKQAKDHIDKKVAGHNRSEDGILSWTVDVNFSQSALGEVTLTDKMTDNQLLLKDTIKVHKVTFNEDGEEQIGEPVTVNVVKATDTELTIELGNIDGQAYRVTYNSIFLGQDRERFGNEASITYSGQAGTGSKDSAVENARFSFNKSSGNIGTESRDVTLEKRGYHLEDGKEKDHGVLEGVTFELWTTTGYKLLTETTDQDGRLTFKNVRYGNYILKEVTPEGYAPEGDLTFKVDADTPYPLNDASNDVFVIKNESLTPEKPEQPENVSYEVLKVDADTKEPLEGVKFELRNEAGEVIRASETNAQGKLTFTNVPEGEYVFVETQALDGYEASNGHHNAVAGGTITVENKKEEVPTPTPETMTVKLTKVDAKDEENVLPGATFKLYQVVEEGEDVLVKNGELETFVTDENGTITVTNLEKGNYYFVEVQAPEGYVLDETPKYVSEDGTLVVKNEKETAPLPVVQQVLLEKVDAANPNIPLEGAEFELFNAAGESQGKYTTDENGKILINGLPKDDYYFVETKAPEGYQLSTEKHHVKNLRVTVKNEKQCEDFTVVVKEDGKPVEKDTEYTFESEDGETKITEKTDKDGKIVIDREKLPEGKYTVTDKDGNKVGEIEVEYDECGTELDITTEEPTKPTDPEAPEQCEDFTVTVKEDGKPVDKDTEYTFESEDGKTTVTEKTDENGKIVIDREELPEGKYTVTDKDGNKVGEIEVEYEECGTELDITTEKPGGGGGGTPPTDPEEPTTPTEPETPEQCEDFTVVVKEDGQPVDKDTEYTFESEDGETKVTEKTDENGKIVIDREKLPEGKYTVTDKDGNKVGEIEVEYEECGTELDITTEKPGGGGGGEDPKDPEEPTTPTDPETPEQCEDFTVVVKEDGQPVEKDTEYTFESEDGKTKVTEKTDENGKIVIDREKLPEGKYTVTDKDGNKVGEIEVEYDECGTELDITTEKPGGGGGGEDPKDPEEPTTPTDPETPEQCEDFTVVVKEDGQPVEKDTEYTFESEDGKTKVTEKTDENGKIVIDREELPEGKYTVTDKDGNKVGEIEVEYDECGTELDITTEKPGGGGGEDPKDPEEPTTPIPGKAAIVLIKVDAKNESKVLEGAIFTLYKVDDQDFIMEGLTTNDQGVIKVENLEAGEYYFVEKRAPKGYRLDRSRHFVTAEKDTEVMTLIENKKRPSGGGGSVTPEEPETPGTGTPEEPETPGTGTPEEPETPGTGTPEEPETPGTGTPEKPETPGTGTPGKPETPGTGTPEEPETPGTGTPEEPETPGTGTPEEPETPGTGTPEKPETPGTGTPEEPETPGTGTPGKPETPGTGTPEKPETPGAETPKEPGKPNDVTSEKEDNKLGLPQTGEQFSWFLLVLASLFVMTGVYFIRRPSMKK